MTESAQRFVAPLTFETLARRPVITSMWERTTEIEPVDVELADWADLLVVAPASANFIGKLAHGLADDMLSCMALTVTRPPLIAPAMNDNMYRHPAVQENILRAAPARLRVRRPRRRPPGQRQSRPRAAVRRGGYFFGDPERR